MMWLGTSTNSGVCWFQYKIFDFKKCDGFKPQLISGLWGFQYTILDAKPDKHDMVWYQH